MKKVFQTKLKSITKVLTLVIVASLATFTGCKSYDEDIDKLNTDMKSLETSLTTKITELNAATVAATDVKIAALTADITALKTRVTALETNGATDAEVTAAIAAAKTDILNKTVSLEALTAYKTEVAAELAALKTKVDAAATQAALTALSTDVNGKIVEVNKTITTLGADVDALEALVAKANTDLAALSGTVGTTVTNLAALKADVNARLATLEGVLTISNGKSAVIDDIKAQLTSQLALINTNKDEIAKTKTELANQKTAIEAAYTAAIVGLKTELLAAIKATGDKATAESAALSEEITELKASIAALVAKDAALEADLKLKALDSSLTALLTSYNAYVASNDKAVADLKTAQEALAASTTSTFDAVNAKIGVINTNLKTIASAIKLNFEALSSRLTSLVFQSDFFVNGIESMSFSTLTYYPCASENPAVITPIYRVRYHMNPSFITAADIDTDNLSFVVNKGTNVVTSYLAPPAAAEDRISATFVEIESGGILVVDVEVEDFDALLGIEGGNTTTWSGSTMLEKFSMVALQVPLSEKAVKENSLVFDDNNVVTIGTTTYPAERLVTSDYARLYYDNMIAPNTYVLWDAYLVKKIVNAELPLTEALAKATTVSGIEGATVTSPSIITLPYGKSIDLADSIMAFHAANIIDFERYGLSFKFDLKQANGTSSIVYNRGDNSTDQQKFINISDASKGTINAKTFSQTEIAAAQGRTPIVRVLVYSKDNATCPVFTAWVKIHIADKPAVDVVNVTVPATTNADPLGCSGLTQEFNVESMNTMVYNNANVLMSKTVFHNIYTIFSSTGSVAAGHSVAQLPDDAETESYKLKWTLTSDYIWSKLYASTTGSYTFKDTVTYASTTPNVYPNVKIVFTKTITKSTLNIPTTQLIHNYWYPKNADGVTVSSFDFVKHNIKTPNPIISTTTVDASSFLNNISTAFEQTTDKQLKYLVYGGTSTNHGLTYKYYFVKPQPAVTRANGSTITLVPSADGQTLTVPDANGNPTSDIIATINPNNATDGDAIVLNQSSTIAKELLNVASENLKARLGLKTYWCNNLTDYVRPVTVNGKASFDIVFVRPINPTKNENGYFIDGRSLPEDHTYLAVDSLVNLSDWRNGAYDYTFKKYPTFKKYYGVTSISIVKSTIKTDLNQSGTTKVLLSQYPDLYAVVDVVPSVAFVFPPATNGYLIYQNNNNTVGAKFNLYVPVTIKYAWGDIVTEVITVPVEKTTGPAGVKRK